MMSQKSSTYRSYLKTALIIPFFLFLGITFGCEPASMEKDSQTENISLELIDTETIILNGQTVSISEFESEFSELSVNPKKALVELKVHKDAPMGLVTDVQEVLREQGALRINYSTVQSNDAQSDQAWRKNLDGRNVLSILINQAGQFLINNEPASLSSVDKLAKEFITNNGKSADLSENPRDAIIRIKTDENTPYDTYKSTVESVLTVYDELRNQASLELFDKPYEALEDRSKEKNQIDNMYPKRISLTPPSNS